MVDTLLITGTVGAGKSTIAAEVSDVLAEREVPNAALDLDALTWQWPHDSRWNADLLFENLASVWPNFEKRGVVKLVLANVLEDPGDLERYRAAVPGAVLTICRLVAPVEARLARLIGRMPPGPSLDWHLHRTTELESILAALAYEHYTVDNGDRTAREVAIDVLERAGWM